VTPRIRRYAAHTGLGVERIYKRHPEFIAIEILAPSETAMTDPSPLRPMALERAKAGIAAGADGDAFGFVFA